MGSAFSCIRIAWMRDKPYEIYMKRSFQSPHDKREYPHCKTHDIPMVPRQYNGVFCSENPCTLEHYTHMYTETTCCSREYWSD